MESSRGQESEGMTDKNCGQASGLGGAGGVTIALADFAGCRGIVYSLSPQLS